MAVAISFTMHRITPPAGSSRLAPAVLVIVQEEMAEEMTNSNDPCPTAVGTDTSGLEIGHWDLVISPFTLFPAV